MRTNKEALAISQFDRVRLRAPGLELLSLGLQNPLFCLVKVSGRRAGIHYDDGGMFMTF